VVGEITAIPIDDGVNFDATTISVRRIHENADYEGPRLEDPHAASRDVRDPPLVALLGALHLGVYVVLEVGGDP
jgi:hypothetical protein